MTPSTPGEVMWFLWGNISGACLVFILAGVAWWFVDVRRAVREGTPLIGEAMERNRKRETQ